MAMKLKPNEAETAPAGAMPEDQAAHLASLEQAAAGGAVPGQGAPAEQAPADPVQESRELWAFVFAVLGGVVPEMARLYPPDRVERIAVAWVPLADKRGWDLSAVLGQWGPEIMFAVAIVPPEIGRAVIALVRAKLNRGKPVESAPVDPLPAGGGAPVDAVQ